MSQVSFNYPVNRLILRENRLSDAEYLAKWFNDRENMRWMDGSDETYDQKEIINDIQEPDKWSLDMTSILKNEERIGYCSIYHIDPNVKSGELSFVIGETKFKGQGMGKELVEGMTRLGFEELGLNALFSTVVKENLPSLKALLANGYRIVPDPKTPVHPGEIYLELTREEYLQRTASKNGICAVVQTVMAQPNQ